MEKIKGWGAIFVTVLTGALLVWWLVVVADRIGVKPVVENGSVVLDEWGRGKEILILVLPLFTATLAYWVGTAGKQDAKAEAAQAKDKLEAVLDQSPQGILKKAMDAHPQAFANTGNGG